MNIKELLENVIPEKTNEFYTLFVLAEDSGDTKKLEEFIDEHLGKVEGYESLKKELIEKCKKESDDEEEPKPELLKRIDDLEKENEILKKNMEKKMATESKLFEKGYDDFIKGNVDLDEVLLSEDYRKGVEKGKSYLSKPEVVIEKKLEAFEQRILNILKEATKKEDKKETVTVGVAYKVGLHEGKKGSSDACFEDEDKNLVDAFKEGLKEGLVEFENKVKPLKKIAENCGVNVDKFLSLVFEGKHEDAFKDVIEKINESKSEKVDSLMENLISFSNSNGSNYVLSEVKKEAEEEPVDDEEKKKMQEKIKKMKKEMDDEEDEEKKNKISEKIKKMKKEMDGDSEEDDDEKEVDEKKKKVKKEAEEDETGDKKKMEEKIKKMKKEMDGMDDEAEKKKMEEKIKKMKKEMDDMDGEELPKDVKEMIEEMKKDKTKTEVVDFEAKLALIEFNDIDDLRKQLVELKEVVSDKDEKSETINKYKNRYGKK